MSSFSYSILPDDSFRLLTLLKNDEDELICDLQNFLFVEAPTYIALSYSWGQEDTCETITSNGRSFPVTPHLLGALHQLHSFAPASKVWVDAMCINQKNDGEKAFQTRRMHDVYRAAQTVFVWLGAADNHSDAALDEMEGLNERLTPILQDDTRERAAFEKGWLENDELTSSGLPDITDPIWRSLRYIYSRPWYTRLWVLQEAALSKEIVVGHGSKRVHWDALNTLAQQLRRANLLGLISGTTNRSSEIGKTILALNLCNIARSFPMSGVFGMTSLMNISRQRDVTEPVDKIYGLLGLVESEVANQITVDYSEKARRDWWNAYIQYSKFQLQSEGTLSILSMASSQYRPESLPTWCPNFNSPPKDVFSFAGVIGYQAGFESTRERIESRAKTCLGSNDLQFHGFRIDRVREVVGSPKHCFEAVTFEGPSGTAALLLEYEAKCLKLSQKLYHSSNEVPEAHWRTLVADTNLSSQSPLAPDIFSDYARSKTTWLSQRDQTTPSFTDLLTASERQGNLNYYQMIEGKSSRTFFSTDGGRVGLGPCDLQAGDIICVLYGGAPLFVLRLEGGKEVARFIGDAFVYGLMDLRAIPAGARGEDEYFTIG